MRAKILAGCLAALVVLRLLLSWGDQRPGRLLSVAAVPTIQFVVSPRRLLPVDLELVMQAGVHLLETPESLLNRDLPGCVRRGFR